MISADMVADMRENPAVMQPEVELRSDTKAFIEKIESILEMCKIHPQNGY